MLPMAENAADSSTTPTGTGTGTSPPPMKDWPVVVDELDYSDPSKAAADSSSLHLLPPPTARSALIKGSHDRVKNVIGPLDFSKGAARACPCCARYVEASGGAACTGQDPATTSGAAPSSNASQQQQQQQQQPEDDHNLPGSLKHGVTYEIHEVLVQGWVHKKGTGLDLFGSRAWKPRWASLVLASVPGYEVDVPLLLIYWFSSSEKPSNVIVLDGTVVMPVDRYKNEAKIVQWNTFTFEIVHTPRQTNATEGDGSPNKSEADKITRTFSVPEKERSDWVHAINGALLDYEKRLNRHRSTLAVAAAQQQRTRAAAARSPVNVPGGGGGGIGGEVGGRPLSPKSPRSARPAVASKPPLSPRSRDSPPGASRDSPLGAGGGAGGAAGRQRPTSPPIGAGRGAIAGTGGAVPPPTRDMSGLRIDMPRLS